MRKSPDLKDAIAEAFIAEFNVSGPRLTLDEVTARIHISKKTIYKYYRSKEDIYEYILRQTIDYILAKQKEIRSNAELSTREKLFAILTIVTPYESVLDTTRLGELKEYEPDFYEKLVEAYYVEWAAVEEVMDEAQKEGLFKEGIRSTMLIRIISGAMSSFLAGTFLKNSNISYTQAIHNLAEVILNGSLK